MVMNAPAGVAATAETGGGRTSPGGSRNPQQDGDERASHAGRHGVNGGAHNQPGERYARPLQAEGGAPHEPAREQDAGYLQAWHNPLPPSGLYRLVIQQGHGKLCGMDAAGRVKVPGFPCDDNSVAMKALLLTEYK